MKEVNKQMKLVNDCVKRLISFYNESSFKFSGFVTIHQLKTQSHSFSGFAHKTTVSITILHSQKEGLYRAIIFFAIITKDNLSY